MLLATPSTVVVVLYGICNKETQTGARMYSLKDKV